MDGSFPPDAMDRSPDRLSVNLITRAPPSNRSVRAASASDRFGGAWAFGCRRNPSLALRARIRLAGATLESYYMFMPAPLAYFLTWTCYGAWLHGDERGSVDDEHAILGMPFVETNPRRVKMERCAMDGSAVTLDSKARAVVKCAIEDHCRFRQWDPLALAVQPNHVHVVVACPPDVPPETTMTQFKAWATRRLREAGIIRRGARVWTKHGSTRWINNRTSLNAAIAYVLEGQ